MFKKLGAVIVVAVTCGVMLPLVVQADPGVLIGAYDPAGDFAELKLDIELCYAPLSEPLTFQECLEQVSARGRLPLVTLEPYPFWVNGVQYNGWLEDYAPYGITEVETSRFLGSDTLMWDCIEGIYDPWYRQIAEVVANYPGEFILRFGHEMELRDVFPWGAKQPGLFIDCYRHVHEVISTNAPGAQILWMWSPAGNTGAEAYYPGDDVVDWVGMTCLENTYWSARTYLAGFSEVCGPRYALLQGFGKPIIIAEGGASGAAYPERLQWLHQTYAALQHRGQHWPLLAGFLYFQAVNTHHDAQRYFPDWRIEAKDYAEIFQLEN